MVGFKEPKGGEVVIFEAVLHAVVNGKVVGDSINDACSQTHVVAPSLGKVNVESCMYSFVDRFLNNGSERRITRNGVDRQVCPEVSDFLRIEARAAVCVAGVADRAEDFKDGVAGIEGLTGMCIRKLFAVDHLLLRDGARAVNAFWLITVMVVEVVVVVGEEGVAFDEVLGGRRVFFGVCLFGNKEANFRR